MREESEDLFGSMMNFAMFERARVLTLLEELEKVKTKSGGTLGRDLPWPSGSAVPAVEAEHQKLRSSASMLPTPQPIGQTTSLGRTSAFLVDSASGGAIAGSSCGGGGFKWRVDLSAMQEGKFEEACECGRCASSGVACKHFKRGLMASLSNWRDSENLKPWQRCTSWERQQGPLFDPLTAQEIVEAADELYEAGNLKNLILPNLNIRQKGAPKKMENMSVAASNRAKSFLEELKDFGDPNVAVRHVLSKGGGNNQGGRGVSKSCSICRRAGRKVGCTWIATHLSSRPTSLHSTLTSPCEPLLAGTALVIEQTSARTTCQLQKKRHWTKYSPTKRR